MRAFARADRGRAPGRSGPDLIADAAEPFGDVEDPAFAALVDRFASARVVLLGEATHGTEEFYRARAALTRRLVAEHGFTIVAVEADWPDAAALNRFVRGRAPRPDLGRSFARFPTWMWLNTAVADFALWLRDHNRARPEAPAGFYGLDLYSLAASMRAVIDHLEALDPEAAAVARRRYGCLEPWAEEPAGYGAASRHAGYGRCEEAVVAMLRDLLARGPTFAAGDPDAFLDAAQNARLVRDAERYYRAMYGGAAESWNLRDTHMFETLMGLLDHAGPGAKAVVWAHNSHIGDARATDMGRRRGELNLGQLCRERLGSKAALIGFGTDRGHVACASDWDEPMEVKAVNASRPDSYERLCLEAGPPRFLLDLRRAAGSELAEALRPDRLERFIGVIYRPETERWSHYAPCSLPDQFDAWIWFDETGPVTPLAADQGRPGADDTFPFGL